MKKMSIAEQTLLKQIDLLREQRTRLWDEHEKISAKVNLLTSLIQDMEQEKENLKAMREKMSERNKK